jgi:hypothetical protein
MSTNLTLDCLKLSSQATLLLALTKLFNKVFEMQFLQLMLNSISATPFLLDFIMNST